MSYSLSTEANDKISVVLIKTSNLLIKPSSLLSNKRILDSNSCHLCTLFGSDAWDMVQRRMGLAIIVQWVYVCILLADWDLGGFGIMTIVGSFGIGGLELLGEIGIGYYGEQISNEWIWVKRRRMSWLRAITSWWCGCYSRSSSSSRRRGWFEQYAAGKMRRMEDLCKIFTWGKVPLLLLLLFDPPSSSFWPSSENN